MDSEFEERWNEVAEPFNGVTIYNNYYDDLPVSRLKVIVPAIVEELYLQYAESRLLLIEDWHNHDGFCKESEESSWPDLRNAFLSVRAMFNSHSNEYEVYNLWFPQGREFILRTVVDHDNFTGSYNVTGSKELINKICQAVKKAGDNNAVVEPAKQYFDRMYGG